MSDIVERLRDAGDRVAKRAMGGDAHILSIPVGQSDVDVICADAADEITRLRAENEQLRNESSRYGSDLSRQMDIANAEANEAERLRAQNERLREALGKSLEWLEAAPSFDLNEPIKLFYLTDFIERHRAVLAETEGE